MCDKCQIVGQKNCKVNMADAAAARREARRRRILENSHSRLQIIAGKAEENGPRESPSKICYPDPDYEVLGASNSSSYCPPPVYNGVVPGSESHELLSTPSDPLIASDTEIVNDLAALISPSTVSAETNSPWEKILAYKYDIVLLALITQMLYSLFTFETAYFFLPLMLYSVTKLMWFPSPPHSNIANALLLLNGISASKAQKIMNITQWVGVISQDTCIYLFTTICIQSLVVTLQSIFT